MPESVTVDDAGVDESVTVTVKLAVALFPDVSQTSQVNVCWPITGRYPEKPYDC